MKTYVKQIAYRVTVVVLAIIISLFVESVYKALVSKNTNRKDRSSEMESIEKPILRNNKQEEVVGLYYGKDSFSTESGSLYVFPDKTWILIEIGCFGGRLRDKGNWVYDNGMLVLTSDKSLKYTQSSRPIFYWLINDSSKYFLMDMKSYNFYSNPNALKKFVPKYSYEKEKFVDFSNYQEFKKKQIEIYWKIENLLYPMDKK